MYLDDRISREMGEREVDSEVETVFPQLRFLLKTRKRQCKDAKTAIHD